MTSILRSSCQKLKVYTGNVRRSQMENLRLIMKILLVNIKKCEMNICCIRSQRRGWCMQYLENQIAISSLKGYWVENEKSQQCCCIALLTYWWRQMHEAFLLAALTVYVWLFDVYRIGSEMLLWRCFIQVSRDQTTGSKNWETQREPEKVNNYHHFFQLHSTIFFQVNNMIYYLWVNTLLPPLETTITYSKLG